MYLERERGDRSRELHYCQCTEKGIGRGSTKRIDDAAAPDTASKHSEQIKTPETRTEESLYDRTNFAGDDNPRVNCLHMSNTDQARYPGNAAAN